MKIIILVMLMMSIESYAVENQNELVEWPEYDEKSFQEESWSDFLTDNCSMYDLLQTKEDALREQGLRRCKDNSVSFVQPKSTGSRGWEGKCGQTFGANSLFSICQKSVDPAVYFSSDFRDITPGVRPGTLKKGMKRIFQKNEACPQKNNWSLLKLGNRLNFIKRVKELLRPNYSHPNLLNINRNGKKYQTNPVGVLIQNPGGKYLHWVTIVDVVKNTNLCHFVVNHWDNQYQVPCKKLAGWSGDVGKSYPLILKSYSVVVYK